MERQDKPDVNAIDTVRPGQPPSNPPPAPPATDDAAGSSGGMVSNIISTVVIVLIITMILRYLDPFSALKVLLGLSFVIFIHELGHFVVAKLCDVHVTHFSIGFGPVIPGCWFKWGETTYQVCLLPLGGYVQMIGQVDGDESSDVGSENDPRSYRNKSVGQRMAIISAGVIMNVILAIICFIVVYRGPGKDRIAGVIANVDGGSPAFVDGVRTEMQLKQIGDIQNPYFDDLRQMVMGSSAGEKIHVVAQRPGDSEKLDVFIEPRKTADDANPVLGLGPAFSTNLLRDEIPKLKTPAEPQTPASRATPPLAYGDVIVAASDPKKNGEVTPLIDDPLKPDQKYYFDLTRRMDLLSGKDFVVRVKRDSGETDITIEPAYRTSIGAVMEMGHIVAVRKNSPAAEAKIQIPEQDANKKFLNGDLIEKVVVDDVTGPKVFEKDTLDPERLPMELKAWARRAAAAGKKDLTVKLFLRHHRREAGVEHEVIEKDLKWDSGYEFEHVYPLSMAAPLAIPELGLSYQIKTTVARVTDPKSPLKAGDVIEKLRATAINLDGKEDTPSWSKRDFRPEEWAVVGVTQLQSGAKLEKIELKVKREGKTEDVSIVPTFDKTWPLTSRGLLLQLDMRKQRADNTLEAIGMGLQDTQKSMRSVLNGIRQMLTYRIDFMKHLGGPISIARIAYSFAGQDFWEFVFFLGMISVNLAVINFLPIPLLDGGHMVFLIYEKLRGQPASEGFRIGATYVGIAFIAGLILLVSYLDIGRL